jgi:hypothetical protein
MQRLYPNQLSISSHHAVVALDDKTVAKIFTDDVQSSIAGEAAAMLFANDTNDLVVKLVRTDFDEQLDADILVMDRLYPLDYRAYQIEKRVLWIEAFMYELGQLHTAGWVHGGIHLPKSGFSNVLLTQQGIRLIDMGKARLKQDTGELVFEKYVRDEWEAVRLFKEFFLGR